MRIACPNCQTLYDVPDHLVGGRPRRLRCEQCGHGWVLEPGAVAREADPVLVEDDETSIQHVPAPDRGEPLGRRFGEAADDEAKAEIRAALKDEALSHHELPAPPPEDADRFADLVRAARNNQMELEPAEPARKPASASNPRLIGLLVVLLVLALIVVERHAVMRLFPASAKLFHALHLG